MYRMLLLVVYFFTFIIFQQCSCACNREAGERFQACGRLQIELFHAQGLEFLSPENFDRYRFVLATGDLEGIFKDNLFDSRHNVSVDFDARSNFIFGYSPLGSSYKLGLGKIVDSTFCSCSNLHLDIFLRSVKAQIAMFDERIKFAMGLFPHDIGSGLVLGDAHKVQYAFPGLYDKYHIDQFRPGIILSIKPFNSLGLDCYYGLSLTRSINLTNNYMYECAQEMTCQPFLGSGVSNRIIHFSLTVTSPEKKFFLQPYLMCRRDEAQQVELPCDSKLSLKNFGFIAKAKNERLGIYTEGVMQQGKQYVKAIDRNICESIGFIQQTHLFVKASLANPERYVWQSARLQTFPEDLGRCMPAGAEFENSGGDDGSKPNITYKNSYNRFRKAYINKLRGLGAYGEFFAKLYNNESYKIKAACGFGYLSSGQVPNDSTEKILVNRLNSTQTYRDCDKIYCGFVGTEQMFNSPRLKAYFLQFFPHLNLGITRKLSHPDTELSNRIFGGFATSFLYKNNDIKVKLNCNILAYGLAGRITHGYSYPLTLLYVMNSDAQKVTDDCLPFVESMSRCCTERYLGTEINFDASAEYKSLLNVFVKMAFLKPGAFYNGVQGNYLSLDLQRKLVSKDFSGIEISSSKCQPFACKPNNAFFINIGFSINM